MEHSGIFYYNKMSRLTKEEDGLDKATSYTHDACGNLSTATTANGDTISHSYNALNRLTRIDYSDDTPDITYYFSDQGELTKASNSNVTYGYEYNAAGVRTSVTNTTL